MITILPGHLSQHSISISSLNVKVSSKDLEVLKKHGFTCCSCGFSSKPHKMVLSGYMQVLKYGNDDRVFCALCASAITLARKIGNSEHFGKLIYAPELSQRNICDMVRIAQMTLNLGSREIDPKQCSRAKSMLDTLLSEDVFLDSQFHQVFTGSQGDQWSLGELCTYASPKIKRNYSKLFKDVRFVPDPQFFKDVISFWYRANRPYFKGLKT